MNETTVIGVQKLIETGRRCTKLMNTVYRRGGWKRKGAETSANMFWICAWAISHRISPPRNFQIQRFEASWNLKISFLCQCAWHILDRNWRVIGGRGRWSNNNVTKNERQVGWGATWSSFVIETRRGRVGSVEKREWDEGEAQVESILPDWCAKSRNLRIIGGSTVIDAIKR